MIFKQNKIIAKPIAIVERTPTRSMGFSPCASTSVTSRAAELRIVNVNMSAWIDHQ